MYCAGFHITATGIGAAERAELYKKAESLGAICSGELNPLTTHLFTDAVNPSSAKYIKAAKHQLPIIRTTWIDYAYRAAKEGTLDMKSIDDYALDIFSDCVISISGHQLEDRIKLKELVKEYDGVFSSAMERNSCTHLIIDTNTGQKYKKAVEWGTVKVVTSKWITYSVEKNRRLPEAEFFPGPKTSTHQVSSNITMAGPKEVCDSTVGRRSSIIPPKELVQACTFRAELSPLQRTQSFGHRSSISETNVEENQPDEEHSQAAEEDGEKEGDLNMALWNTFGAGEEETEKEAEANENDQDDEVFENEKEASTTLTQLSKDADDEKEEDVQEMESGPLASSTPVLKKKNLKFPALALEDQALPSPILPPQAPEEVSKKSSVSTPVAEQRAAAANDGLELSMSLNHYIEGNRPVKLHLPYEQLLANFSHSTEVDSPTIDSDKLKQTLVQMAKNSCPSDSFYERAMQGIPQPDNRPWFDRTIYKEPLNHDYCKSPLMRALPEQPKVIKESAKENFEENDATGEEEEESSASDANQDAAPPSNAEEESPAEPPKEAAAPNDSFNSTWAEEKEEEPKAKPPTETPAAPHDSFNSTWAEEKEAEPEAVVTAKPPARTIFASSQPKLAQRDKSEPSQQKSRIVFKSSAPRLGRQQSDTTSEEEVSEPSSKRSKPSTSYNIILFTGFSDKDKKNLQEQVHALQPSCNLDASSDELANADFVVCDTLQRSKKLLAALAAGKCIVSSSYIIQSNRAGEWLQLEEFEYGNPKNRNRLRAADQKDEKIAKQIFESCYRCRIKAKSTGVGFFHGWNVILFASHDAAQSHIQIIQAGDGKGKIFTEVPEKDYSKYTHALVSAKSNIGFSQKQAAALTRHKIPYYIDMAIPDCLLSSDLEATLKKNQHIWYSNLLKSRKK